MLICFSLLFGNLYVLMLICFSLLFGNLYTYFSFGGEMVIDAHTRSTLFIVLTSVATAGVLVMFLLRTGLPADENDAIVSLNERFVCKLKCYDMKLDATTVKPVFKGHIYIREQVSLHDRCPFITGSLTWGR